MGELLPSGQTEFLVTNGSPKSMKRRIQGTPGHRILPPDCLETTYFLPSNIQAGPFCYLTAARYSGLRMGGSTGQFPVMVCLTGLLSTKWKHFLPGRSWQLDFVQIPWILKTIILPCTGRMMTGRTGLRLNLPGLWIPVFILLWSLMTVRF